MFIYLAWHKVSLTLSYQYNQAQGSENNFKTLYFVQASGWSIHQFKHPFSFHIIIVLLDPDNAIYYKLY